MKPNYKGYTILKDGTVYGKKGQLMTQRDSGKYKEVALYYNSKMNYRRIHQLVAEVYLNHTVNGYDGLVVDHIDNNPLNNNASNLQLITARENVSKDRANSTNYTGVQTYYNQFNAKIKYEGVSVFLGSYSTPLEAHLVYLGAAETIKTIKMTNKLKNLI